MLDFTSKKMVERPLVVREWFLVLFLAFVTLGIYYPAILGEFFTMDDLIRMNSILNASTEGFSELIGIGASNAYRRPLTLLTHYFIYKVTGDQAITFHLFNVVLHLFNGILLYFLLKLYLKDDSQGSVYGFFAALFFLLHPVNVESVAWISGNSGVMATSFILLTLLFHISSPGRQDHWRLWAAAAFYLLSLLTKESGLMMILVVVWFDLQQQSSKRLVDSIMRCYQRWIPYGTALGCYMLIRISESLWHWSRATSRGSILNYSFDPNIDVLLKSIAGLGFYLRKLFWPWPLNFHIGQIATAPYFLIGLVFLLLLLFWMWRRRWPSLWGWSFLCGLAPVLALTFIGMSWTPVAERYVYLSSIFFVILVILFLREGLSRPVAAKVRWAGVLPLIVLAIFATSATRRAQLWQTSLGLMDDTLRQSPQKSVVLSSYGYLLSNLNRVEEAETYCRKALELEFNANAAMFLGHMEKSRKNYREAERYYLEAAWPSNNVKKFVRNFNPDIYLALAELHWNWAMEDEENSGEHYERAVHFYRRAYEFSGKKTFILYMLAKVHLEQGNLEEARNCFRQVFEEKPETYYGKAAAKLMHITAAKTKES